MKICNFIGEIVLALHSKVCRPDAQAWQVLLLETKANDFNR